SSRSADSGTRPATTASASRPRRASVAVASVRRSPTAVTRGTREGGQPGLDVILDPMRVPPLDRIDVDAVNHGAEVEVIARGQTRVAGLPDRVASGDRL